LNPQSTAAIPLSLGVSHSAGGFI